MLNKEFILNIQDKIESTLKEGNSKIQLQRLIKTIDSEVSKNDNWDEFAYHFDQVHEEIGILLNGEKKFKNYCLKNLQELT